MSARRGLRGIVVVVLVLALAVAGWVTWNMAHVASVKAPPALPIASGRTLLESIADDAPNAAQLRRGQ